MPRAELARFSAPFFSVLPDLFVAGDDTREIHSLAPGVAANALAGPPQRRFRIPRVVGSTNASRSARNVRVLNNRGLASRPGPPDFGALRARTQAAGERIWAG
jgi:hypothetical protein